MWRFCSGLRCSVRCRRRRSSSSQQRVTRVRLPAGASVFKQGDEGDDFYVIDGGHAEVILNGQPDPARFEPGDRFGEIALVREFPGAQQPCARHQN